MIYLSCCVSLRKNLKQRDNPLVFQAPDICLKNAQKCIRCCCFVALLLTYLLLMKGCVTLFPLKTIATIFFFILRCLFPKISLVINKNNFIIPFKRKMKDKIVIIAFSILKIHKISF